MSKPIIIIDTVPYVRSHGKMPKGRGAWMFQLDNDAIVTESGTFTQARAKAKAKAVKDAKKRFLSMAYLTVMP